MKTTEGLPGISVCIPSLNRARTLEKTLRTILAQDYPAALVGVLLRDDGSSDDTAAVMNAFAGEFKKKGFREVSVFKNEAAPNLIAARNFLAKKVADSSSLMLVMDDDVYLEPDSLRLMAGYFYSLRGCAALGPRVVFESDRKKTAAAANFVNGFTGTYREADVSGPLECDWLSSCCLLIEMSAWKKIGGLCEAFYTCHEEPDFCLRAKKAGFKIVYYPLTTVRHDVNISMQRRAKNYYLYRNKLWFIRRNFPWPLRISALMVSLFLGLPKYLLESVLYNKKIVIPEILNILRAVRDGFLLDW